MTIEKIENGYIVYSGYQKLYCSGIKAVFDRLLLDLEGRCSNFSGEKYGRVFVATSPDQFLLAVERESEGSYTPKHP